MRKQKIIGIVIIIVIILAILGINNRNIFNGDEQVIQDKQQIKQENLTIDEKVDKTVRVYVPNRKTWTNGDDWYSRDKS